MVRSLFFSSVQQGGVDSVGPQVLCFPLRGDQSASGISWDAPTMAALGKVMVGGQGGGV